MKKIFLTFDIETDWGGRLLPIRENCLGIEYGLPWLIETLDKFDIKATFFISGEIASLFSDYIVEIRHREHEIASHAYSHRLSFENLTYDELKSDIVRSQEALAKITDEQPFGFRTPQFRFNKNLLQVLGEAGFKYDSSVCKSLFSRGNDSEEIIPVIQEHSVSVWSLLKLPAGLLWIHKAGLRYFLSHCRRSKKDIVIYAHPFDWYKKRVNMDYSLKVNAWYLLSPHNQVKNCLFKMMKQLKEEGFNFKLLSDK